MFKNERTNTDNVEREGRPSTATNSKTAVHAIECILVNRRITIDKMTN